MIQVDACIICITFTHIAQPSPPVFLSPSPCPVTPELRSGVMAHNPLVHVIVNKVQSLE